MKKIYWVSLPMCLIILVGGLFNRHFEFEKSADLFEDIINQTKSQVVEYGLKASTEVETDGEKECVNILRRLELDSDNSLSIDVLKNGNLYCIDFKSDEVSGYIQYSKHEEKGIITVEIVEHKETLGLEKLKSRVEAALNRDREEVKYFLYGKARTELDDPKLAKDIMVGVLKKIGALHIETVDLEKGLSTTAFTGRYELMKNGKGWIDFNCAVYSYDSGNYVIIGTPIIMTSY